MSDSPAHRDLVPRSAEFDAAPHDVPHARPFLLDLRVGRDHLSTVIDHVSNVEYVRWLDRAAELHADACGYRRTWLLQRNLMWFVARHEIDYLAEARLGDDLVVATWVRDMKRIRSWRDFAIIRPADQTMVCRAATLWVLVDLETRRPVRIAQEMVRRFDPLEAPAGALGSASVQGTRRSCASQ